MNCGVSWGYRQRAASEAAPESGEKNFPPEPPSGTRAASGNPARRRSWLTRLRLLLRGRDIYINMYTTAPCLRSSSFLGGSQAGRPPKKSVFSDSPGCPREEVTSWPPPASASWPPEARPEPSPISSATGSGSPSKGSSRTLPRPSSLTPPETRPAWGNLWRRSHRPVERRSRPLRPELRVLRAARDVRGHQQWQRH